MIENNSIRSRRDSLSDSQRGGRRRTTNENTKTIIKCCGVKPSTGTINRIKNSKKQIGTVIVELCGVTGPCSRDGSSWRSCDEPIPVLVKVIGSFIDERCCSSDFAVTKVGKVRRKSLGNTVASSIKWVIWSNVNRVCRASFAFVKMFVLSS